MASTDLTITMNALPDPVNIGQDLTITVTVCNEGPDQATGVKITSSLPAGLCLKGITVEQGTYTYISQELTWYVGELDTGTCKKLSYIAVPTAAGTIHLGASVTGTETDPDFVNNAATVPVIVLPSADLAVYKNVCASDGRVGESLTYLVTVVNNGPSAATGVTLSDDFDGDTTDLVIDSIEISQGSCGPVVNEAFVCSLGVLAPHEIAQLTVVASPGVEGTLLNTVQVTSDVQDPMPDNNSTDLIVNVAPMADLAVVKTVTPHIAVVGQEIQYNITVTNNGPSDATGVTVNDFLPSLGLNVVSVLPSVPVSGNEVTWTFSSLPIGGSETMTITAIPTQSGIISNSVSAKANESDPNLCNNSAIIQVFVGSASGTDLSVTKTHCPETVKVCKPLTFIITVTNNGPEVATGVTLYDQLLSSMKLSSVTTSQGRCCCSWKGGCGIQQDKCECTEECRCCDDNCCDDNCCDDNCCNDDCSGHKEKCQTLQDIVCHLGSLAVGASAVVEIEVRPQMTGTFSNTALVTANQTELDSGNNQATDTVTVLYHKHRD